MHEKDKTFALYSCSLSDDHIYVQPFDSYLEIIFSANLPLAAIDPK